MEDELGIVNTGRHCQMNNQRQRGQKGRDSEFDFHQLKVSGATSKSEKR